MSENKERKGVLTQIVVAVVVALLAGGTAPWWWSKIFPEQPGVGTNSNPVLPKPPRTSVQGKPIRVQCSVSPYFIPPGGQAGIRVFAFNEQNIPISGANVLLESGGGLFSGSGTTTEVGQTDSGGVFMTQWKSPNPAAREYVMSVSVNRDGLLEGKGECNVPIQ